MIQWGSGSLPQPIISTACVPVKRFADLAGRYIPLEYNKKSLYTGNIMITGPFYLSSCFIPASVIVKHTGSADCGTVSVVHFLLQLVAVPFSLE